MFSAALVALAVISSVFADPHPTTPGASDQYTAGGTCTVGWTVDPDTAAPWTNMSIQLMTGINTKMTAMRTIATGIDASKDTTFNWTCPEVNPAAPIYFYQFSDPSAPTDQLWVTRFLIKGTDGSSVAAPLTDSGGIAYGNGAFVDPSLYNAPPAYLAGNGQIIGSAGNSTSPGTSVTSGSLTSSNTPIETGSTTPIGTTTPSTGSTSPTGSVVKITSPASSSPTASSTQTSTTASTGAASVSFVSSSWSVVFGALIAVAAVAV